MRDAVIISAMRTPTGKFQGALKDFTAPELGAIAIKAAVEKAGIKPEEVDEVIMGCVVQAGLGQAPARQAALKAGLTPEVSALTINMVCGSGLRAVALAAQSVMLGDAEVVVAGGMESMSNVHTRCRRRVTECEWAINQAIDLMIHDGLWCPFENWHMGNTGEVVSEKHQITREHQGRLRIQFAPQSARSAQRRTVQRRNRANRNSAEKRRPVVLDYDETVRGETTVEILGKLKPAFKKENGTVTAGNAPGRERRRIGAGCDNGGTSERAGNRAAR
jgi:acetyl-CoA C-acetyltransferase